MHIQFDHANINRSVMTRVAQALPRDFPRDYGFTYTKSPYVEKPALNYTKMTQLFQITEDKLPKLQRDYLQIDFRGDRKQKPKITYKTIETGIFTKIKPGAT